MHAPATDQQALTSQEVDLLHAFEQLSEEDQLAFTQIAEQIAVLEVTAAEPLNRNEIEAMFATLRKVA
ncbi:MAG: hypothetical protein ACRYGK_04575 [Janthinobacterium lividum]